MKYIRVDWPEIQDFMDRLDFKEECCFDPIKNAWFIPDFWDEPDVSYLEEPESGTEDYFNMRDAIGADWEG